EARAEHILRAAQFKVVVRQAFSDTIDRGIVISVDPGEATKTAYCDPVTITVSQGPEEFSAPNLVVLSVDPAKAEAVELGLQFITYALTDAVGNTVRTQLPPAGT